MSPEAYKARDGHRGRGARRLRHVLTGAFLLAFAMVLGAGGFIIWGVYDVSAVQQHTAPVFHTLDAALKRSISRRARDIEPPPLGDPAMFERGFRIFRKQCVQCHGAPGVARDDLGKGLTPLPANLVHTARSWSAGEIYWTISNGIKMSGMPAWRFKYSEEEMWAVVAFIKQLPRFTPAEYRQFEARIAAEEPQPQAPAPMLRKPDMERGRLALRNYACTACHAIPGVVGPGAPVGPPLEGIGARRYIAGVLPNSFENMVLWIRNPVEVDPLTAMPDLDVSAQDAADIAAYLGTLE